MRVFLTGATGFVGTAVTQELIQAGHTVLGLARSERGAQALALMGAEPHRGSLEDLDSLRDAAQATDATIHCGFIHDFTNYAHACAVDRGVVEAVGAALAGSQKPFLLTSGLAGYAPDRLATEEDMPSHEFPRSAAEALALRWVESGVRVGIVRLAPSVHGAGDHGFVPMLIQIAREQGVAAYIEKGENRWSAVHRQDVARLYRLALEQGVPGGRYHGVGEEGIPSRALAEAIGRGLNLPVRAVSRVEAAAHFGWMAHFFAMNLAASSLRTQQRLGWQPTHHTLLEDLAHGGYFA